MKHPSTLLVLAVLVGCGAEPELETPSEELRAIPLSGPDSPTQVRGLGVAFPVQSSSAEDDGTDTLVVRASPDDSAPIVARFVRSSSGYTIEAGGDAAQGGGLAYGYEEVGLPLLDTAGHDSPGDWLRVHYATSASGGHLEGWIRRDAAQVGALMWTDHLQGLPLYFLDSDSIAFHESVDGPRVEIALAPGDGQQRFDYIMHSLETQGPWMRAEVVSPSNYCADPRSPVRDTVWVRYLDAGSQPRVWYYTRGC